MKQIILLTYIVGLAIGFFIYILIDDYNTFARLSNTTVQSFKNILVGENTESVKNTVEDIKKIRILCFLNTSPAKHGERAVHVHQLWGKHCDKLLFASTLTDINLDALGFNVTDNHQTMWGKEKLMLQFINKHFLNDYDWFYKGDDDTFAIIENMRFFLSAYSREDPIYFGYKFKGATNRGYFSGGSGYGNESKMLVMCSKNIIVVCFFCFLFYSNESESCSYFR